MTLTRNICFVYALIMTGILFFIPVNGGYTREGLEVLHAMLRLHFVTKDGTLTPIRMLEFGDQVLTTMITEEDDYAPFQYYNFVMPYQRPFDHVYDETFLSKRERQDAERREKLKQTPAKKYFEHIGFDHISIDYNGDNDALPLDVREDLTVTKSLQNKHFDMITNIGFSEHVGEDVLTFSGNEDQEKELVWISQYLLFENFHNLGDVGTLYHHHVPSHDPTHWLAHGICGYSPEFFSSLISHNNYSSVLGPLFYSQTMETITMYKKQNNNSFMSLEEFKTLPLYFKFHQHFSFVFDFHTEGGETVKYGIDNTSPEGVLETAHYVCNRHVTVNDEIQACINAVYQSLSELVSREKEQSMIV